VQHKHQDPNEQPLLNFLQEEATLNYCISCFVSIIEETTPWEWATKKT